MSDTNRNREIAETIALQLGGLRRLGVMVDLKFAEVVPNGLAFRFKARAAKRINHIAIKLEPSDTYTVEFWSVRAGACRKVSEYSDVYADSLRRIIESETGLYLSLGTLGAVG